MSVIIIDKATRSLSAAQAAMHKTLTELNLGVAALVEEQTALATDIHFKGEELKEVTAKVETAAREAAAELRLRVKEDEDEVLENLLEARGLVSTTEADIKQLNAAVEEAQAALTKAEFTAVKEAEQRVIAKYEAVVKSMTADHKVELAELYANANTSKAQISTLTEQVQQLRDDLRAEREARVAMAEAASKAQAVTVNTGK